MKSKYEEYVKPRFAEIEEWISIGLSEEQVAHNLGISWTTFKDYKKKYPSLSALVVRAKQPREVELVNAFYKRAKGYDAVETREVYEVTQDPTTGADIYHLVSVIKQTKHVPGDARAVEFILSHTNPEKWGKNDSIIDSEEDAKKVLVIPKRQLIEEITVDEGR